MVDIHLGFDMVHHHLRRVTETLAGGLGLWQQDNQEAYDHSTRPLDESKNEIRLLLLQKRGPFPELLKVELISASVDSPPPYEAMSYYWGTVTTKKTIPLGGKPFSCFPSAYSLLPSRSSWFKDRLLWIDAICINQDDIVERCKEVQIMWQIYENATRVIVWPGDSASTNLTSSMLYDLYLTSIMHEGTPYGF